MSTELAVSLAALAVSIVAAISASRSAHIAERNLKTIRRMTDHD